MEKYDQHQIDEYLLGNMAGDELAFFEKKLKGDPSLQKEVKNQQLLMDAVDTLGDLRMRERVKLIHQRATQQPTLVRRINIRAFAIAAIGLIALGICLWIWLRPPLNERLYADFYEPYPITFSSRSNDTDRQLVESSRLYKNGDFKKAALIFEKYADINNDDKLLLAAGISFMEINDHEKALRYFQTIMDFKDSPFMGQAQWYVALIHLKEGDIEKCKKYLGLLVKEKKGFYFEKALSLNSILD